MKKIDKVYAEDLKAGDIVTYDGKDFEKVLEVKVHGYAVYVVTDADSWLEYPFGTMVAIYSEEK